MAYRLNELKIVPTGLNLLAPVDQIAPGDCLDLFGLWPGSAGRVEVAPPAVQVSAASPADCHTVYDAGGRIYYADIGNLRQVGRAGEAPIDSGYDGYPLGLISYQGYVWIINRSQQRKDDGTSMSNWTQPVPAAPLLTDGGTNGAGLLPPVNNPPEVGGLQAQAYLYYITWVGPTGETNPSPAGTITPAVNGSIVRVALPSLAPGPWVKGWNIYRRSPTFSAPYRLNENVIEITRPYVDDYGNSVHAHDDDQLLQLGIIMEADHDPAPAARIIGNQIYNGRIIVANSLQHPNRIWYTQPLQPAFFRGAANENDGDWVDIGTDSGDEILALSCRPNFVIVYRAKSIWRHYGDFGSDTARIEVVVPEMGIVGPRAVACTSTADYFRGPEGIYQFNFDWAKKISAKIDTVFRGISSENYIAEQDKQWCALGVNNGRLWVSYHTSGGMTPINYHLESDRWFGGAGLSGYFAFAISSNGLLAAGNGVYRLESGTGSNPIGFQTAYEDCGYPDHEKTFADLVLSYKTGGNNLDIIIRTNKLTNNSTDTFTLATINSSARTKQIIPLVYPATYVTTALRGLPIRAYNISIRITGGAPAGPPAGPSYIDSPILLHYYLEARRGKSWDTDETEQAIVGMKEIDQVEFDIDATDGAATLQVYSDTPGGIMTARLAGGQAIAATTGRQSRRMNLSAVVDGKLLRYQITTATDFQLYAARARVLPIGVYLDSSLSDFWQPTPISIGV